MIVRLRDGLRAALKARDRVAVSALRSALAAIENAGAIPPLMQGVDGNEHVAGAVAVGAAEAERRVLSEDDVRAIVAREADERLAAAAEYEQGGRGEHAERLRLEAEVLSRYLN